MQTIEVPWYAVNQNMPCTTFVNMGDTSMALVRSRGGTAITFPCFAVEPQVGLGSAAYNPADYPRVVARLTQDGVVDTSQGCADCYYGTGTYLFSALLDETITPNRFWMTGNIGAGPAGSGGTRTFVRGSRTSTGIVTGGTYRTLATDGRRLYVTYSG